MLSNRLSKSTSRLAMKVFLLLSCVFCEILQRTSAECINLERIFRTPKDMSKVNFDHFEMVERGDFDLRDTSTVKPPAVTTPHQPSGSNVANAQVLVRFGVDEGHANNHIMRIPPQATRYFAGAAPHDAFYPVPPHGFDHFYHPYPPPVPFVFPNYYFREPSAQFLPPQLGEFFGRHPEFFHGAHPAGQVFIQGRPLKPDEVGGVIPIAKGRDLKVRSEAAVPVVVVDAPKSRNPIAKRSCQSELESAKCNLVSTEELKKPLVSLGDLLKKPSKGLSNSTSFKLLVSFPTDNPEDSSQVTTVKLPSPTARSEDRSTQEQNDASEANDKEDLVTIVVAVEEPSEATPTAIPGPQLKGIELDVVNLESSFDLDWSGLHQKHPKCATELPNVVLAVPPRDPVLTKTKADLDPFEASNQDQFSYFFLPEPNVAVRQLERHPKNLPALRDDYRASQVCRRCGQRHGGGNFCTNCGCPVVLGWPFCGTCPK